MDPVSAIGLVASVVQTISAVSELIQYANTLKHAPEEQAVLAREAASFASFLTAFRYDIQNFDLFRPEYAGLLSLASEGGPLIDVQLVTTRLLRKLRRKSRLAKIFRSLKWPLEKWEVEQMLSRIESLKSTISLALATDNMTTTWRDVTPAQGNDSWSMTRSGDGLRSRHKHCGVTDNQDPARLSSRKSLLIDTVRRQSGQQQKIGIAYIYFNYKEEQTQKAESMISSLLEQLARAQPDMRPGLLSTYNLYKKKGCRPSLSELTSLLQGEARQLSKAFFFVDALDECSSQDGNMERFIAAIRSLQPMAHMIVTSRLSPSSLNAGGLDANLVIEIKASDADIRRYLGDRMRNEERLSRLLWDDVSLRAAVADRITENTQGMFLLAQLQMDFVARKNNRRDIRRSLGHLPRQLSDVYEAALSRIANQNREDAELAEQLPSWIVCAQRPLTRVEVQHALAVEPADMLLDEEGIPDNEILIAACAGLVTVDRESSIVRLVH
ncbi:hypothetical protein MFIFM68171_02915 [Madurella fahalii]|uniref:NACHT domain-containing protein n=1 Tax=Madurella fahalii TaxID=1157608 RepID=A0ABQ0G565_9PEZI